MTDQEYWRTVPDTEGLYQVSSHGRLKRIGNPSRIVKGSTNSDGYLCCALCIHGRRMPTKIHTLVALTFLGPRPTGHHVNHKSGNKTDNSLDNLEYVTLENNLLHAKANGIAGGGVRGSANTSAKLTENQVRDIRRRYPSSSLKELADEYGVTKSNISCITRRKTWRHIA